MSQGDGISLRDLARLEVFDPRNLWGPAPLLLFKADSLDDEAPVQVNTPADVDSGKGITQCSTAELVLGEETVSAYVAPGSIVVPVRKTQRNPWEYGVILGRAQNCDIRLYHPSVSKVHCYLVPPKGWPAIQGIWKIRDDSSTNGTHFLLGSGPFKVEKGKAPGISYGAELRFGSVDAIFLDPAGLEQVVMHAVETWASQEAHQGPLPSDTQRLRRDPGQSYEARDSSE